MTQREFRQQLRATRRNITGETRETLSRDLVSNVLTYLDNTVSVPLDNLRVATFLSMPEEIDTRYLNDALLARRTSLFLPVVIAPNTALQFAPYHADSALAQGTLSIPIPDVPQSDYIHGRALDVCIVPLVGFDHTGNRIGMGGGFYDRTFAFLNSSHDRQSISTRPYLLGIAYDAQQVDAIARNDWDVKLDGLITPTTHYTFT